MFTEYLLCGKFVQGYSTDYLAYSRIQAKEKIVINQVKANRIWKKDRSYRSYRPSGESFQGFEQRRNKLILVIRAQEMFCERLFKAFMKDNLRQNEKNFP